MSYRIVLQNHAPRLQRQVEPLVVRVEVQPVALPKSLKAVTFAPVSFRAVSCTRPMVYGVGGTSPRIRMRRDDQLGVRQMRAARYEVIAER